LPWFCDFIQKNLVVSLVGHFPEMAMVTLIRPQKRLKVSGRILISQSNLFAGNLTLGASPCALKSQVSLADFREFVAALRGQPVAITNGNFRGLSQLCEEFGLRDLAKGFHSFANLVILKKRRPWKIQKRGTVSARWRGECSSATRKLQRCGLNCCGNNATKRRFWGAWRDSRRKFQRC
jgi:hypothetical protein